MIKRIRAGRGEIDHPADESHALANDEAIEHVRLFWGEKGGWLGGGLP